MTKKDLTPQFNRVTERKKVAPLINEIFFSHSPLVKNVHPEPLKYFLEPQFDVAFWKAVRLNVKNAAPNTSFSHYGDSCRIDNTSHRTQTKLILALGT